MSTRPKRRKKSAGARLRPFWILFVLIAIVAGVAGYYAATWPGFYPKPVTVSGNKVVPAAQILSHAQIEARENIWLQNMRKAAQRIDAIPYVKTASIHRSLPAGVRIAVTERTPFAILRTNAGRAVVDHDLRVLPPEGRANALPVIVTKLASLPIDGAFVKDADALRLRDDFDALAAAHVAVRSLHFDKFGDLVAGTRGGISLLLGDDSDLAKKTPLIDPIISQVSATGKKLAAVDLRAPKTPVVVYRH
jgi:cell division septal protein FtsQ